MTRQQKNRRPHFKEWGSVTFMSKKWLLFVLAPFALAGCYDLTTDFVVSEDGSGTFSGAFEVDLEAIEDLGGDLSECDGYLEGFIEEDNGLTNGEYEVVNNPDRCAVLFDGEWNSGEPILNGDEETQENFTVTPTATGNGWRFEAVVADPDEETEELGGLLEFATLHVSIEMPGEIVDHNGELSEGVVSWELLAVAPDPATLFVVSTIPEEEEPTTTTTAVPTTTVASEEAETDNQDGPESEDEESAQEVADGSETSANDNEEQPENEESEEVPALEDDGNSSTLLVVILVTIAALISGGGAFLLANRRSTGTPKSQGLPDPPNLD